MRFLFLLPVILLAACVTESPPLLSNASLQVVEGSSLPVPVDASREVAVRPYVIGPLDKLRIDTFGIEELQEREIQVDSGGYISYPIAGVVEAAGKTPGELGELLQQRLREGYVRDPQVTVNLEETVSQQVTVDGQVLEPGTYPVVAGMTLMRAVASARGLSEYAKLDDVVVFRTVAGQRYAALYNMGAIRRGYYPDPDIYPNDVVVVGDSPGKRLFDDIIEASALITTPIIALVNGGVF